MFIDINQQLDVRTYPPLCELVHTMTIAVREHSHTIATGIGRTAVSADMVKFQRLLKGRAGGVNMTTEKNPKSTAELLRAQIRLGMIARMVRVNIDESPEEDEFPEIMETILAACGQEDAQ